MVHKHYVLCLLKLFFLLVFWQLNPKNIKKSRSNGFNDYFVLLNCSFLQCVCVFLVNGQGRR